MSRSADGTGGGGLHRRKMADGGEVVSGGLAKKALRSVGARAMTLDHTILVDDTFDPNKAEDQALYAHERHHDAHSGGVGDKNDKTDAEERTAQAIESMVLHRAKAGESFDTLLRAAAGIRPGDAVPKGNDGPQGTARVEPDDEADAAYKSLLGAGWTHAQIVRSLASFVVESVLDGEDDRHHRTGNRTTGLL
jgi:hypothetical protein